MATEKGALNFKKFILPILFFIIGNIAIYFSMLPEEVVLEDGEKVMVDHLNLPVFIIGLILETVGVFWAFYLFGIVEVVFYYIKRYTFPVLFLVAGIAALKVALTPEVVELNNGMPLKVKQDTYFLVGALVLLLGSIIWFLYLLGIIKTMIGYGIMGVMAIISVFILYYDYAVIAEEVRFNNQYAERETEIKVRIMDIKAAELAYKQSKGHFTDNMDDLVSFVKNGQVMDFIKNGNIPDRKITPEERDIIYGDDRAIDFLMTEYEATMLARANPDTLLDGKKFQRDTIMVPVMDAIFNSDRYKTSREKMGEDLIAFHPDSMRYVPYTQNPVELDTGRVPKGDIVVPTLQIKMTHPMEDPIEGYVDYTVGSLSDNHLRESWDK